jgi:NAD(P)-dependent dehydrogenase (short-subunit alcohol dehydrogenase family)
MTLYKSKVLTMFPNGLHKRNCFVLMMKNIAIIGSTGAIGAAFTQQLSELNPGAKVHAFSHRKPLAALEGVFYHSINYQDEASIEAAAVKAATSEALDMILVATGMLHEENMRPEKSLRELSAAKFKRLFEVNTIVPALVAKHFLPRLHTGSPSVFGVLSARAGSISDNQMGGWYAYRAAKAALNMIIKNAAIEVGRRNKQAIIVGLYPGMVDSELSKPFQRGMPPEKIFTPDFAVQKLIALLTSLKPEQSGRFFDWDGQEVLP